VNIFDSFESNQKSAERGPDLGVSESLPSNPRAPYDCWVPRPDLGPGVYSQFNNGASIPRELLWDGRVFFVNFIHKPQ